MSWQRLIRFTDVAGEEKYGEPIIDQADNLQPLVERGLLSASVWTGHGPFGLQHTGEQCKVRKLLPVLTSADVPIIKCIGLNYAKHIKEAGRSPPPYPSFFIKPRASVGSFDEDIPIPKICQNDQCDWEGELSIIIGKTGKNISRNEALQYVAGYMVSNDISARKWQRDPAYAGSVPQWCFSKGFDKWAPLGPMIVSPALVGSADSLRLQTFVDGGSVQDSNTSDLIYSVERIIEFISQGSTLEQGTVIMTGTPSGVAMGRSPPPWLKDGQLVEVKIEQLGSTRNKIRFE